MISNTANWATIVDLPNELLHEIFRSMDDDDLFAMLLLSKRLHNIAFEILVPQKRRRIRPQAVAYTFTEICHPPPQLIPSHLIITDMRVLRALRLSISIHQVGSLSVVAGFVTTAPPAGLDSNYTVPMVLTDVSRFMRGLARLCRRIPQVQTVDIDFMSSLSSGLASLPGGTAAAAEILTAISIGHACISLKLGGWQIEARPEANLKIPMPPPLTTLLVLNLSLTELIDPVFRAWAIGTINASRLTELVLNRVKFSVTSPTVDVLRLLDVPSLITFRIISPDVNFDDLLVFMRHHHRIQKLSVITIEPITSPEAFPEELLPNLSDLTAPPHYVSHLVKSPKSLARLHSITIHPGHEWDHHQLTSTVVDRHLQDLEDCLDYMSCREKLATLAICLPTGAHAENWLQHGRGDGSKPRKDVEANLVHITSLDIHDWCGFQAFSPAACKLLVRWLALFPSLQSVRILDGVRHMTSIQRSAFESEIWEHCPQLNSLGIGWHVKERGKSLFVVLSFSVI